MAQRQLTFTFRHDNELGGFVTLEHRRSKPFIITLQFATEQSIEEWACDIELFRQALEGHYAGIGDLRVYPAREDPEKLVIYLANEEVCTEVFLDRAIVEDFIRPIKTSALESAMWVNLSLRRSLGI